MIIFEEFNNYLDRNINFATLLKKVWDVTEAKENSYQALFKYYIYIYIYIIKQNTYTYLKIFNRIFLKYFWYDRVFL